jgi:hypothetical protein
MLVGLVVGFVQAAAGVAVAVWWRQRHPVIAPGDTAAQFVHGLAQLLYFLFATVWGWLALWLFCEGLLRVLATAMQQPFSTLPVVVARAAWQARPRRKLPPDEINKRSFNSDGGEEIVIDSARAYDWHALTTVEIDDALYSVTREAGTKERPYRYRLRPIAHDHVVRTLTRYAPPLSDRDRDGSSRTSRPPRR